MLFAIPVTLNTTTSYTSVHIIQLNKTVQVLLEIREIMYLKEYCEASFKYLNKLLMTNDNPLDFSQTQVFISFWRTISSSSYVPGSDSSGHKQNGVITDHKDRYIEHIFLCQSPTYNCLAQPLTNNCFHSTLKEKLNIFFNQNISTCLSILCNLKPLLVKTMLYVWGIKTWQKWKSNQRGSDCN